MCSTSEWCRGDNSNLAHAMTCGGRPMDKSAYGTSLLPKASCQFTASKEWNAKLVLGGVVRSKHLESSVRIRYVVYYRRGGECTHEQFQSQKNILFRPFRGKVPKCPQVASKCVAKINFRDETQLHGFHLVLLLRPSLAFYGV